MVKELEVLLFITELSLRASSVTTEISPCFGWWLLCIGFRPLAMFLDVMGEVIDDMYACFKT